jgi:hypothetical protein
LSELEPNISEWRGLPAPMVQARLKELRANLLLLTQVTLSSALLLYSSDKITGWLVRTWLKYGLKCTEPDTKGYKHFWRVMRRAKVLIQITFQLLCYKFTYRSL